MKKTSFIVLILSFTTCFLSLFSRNHDYCHLNDIVKFLNPVTVFTGYFVQSEASLSILLLESISLAVVSSCYMIFVIYLFKQKEILYKIFGTMVFIPYVILLAIVIKEYILPIFNIF